MSLAQPELARPPTSSNAVATRGVGGVPAEAEQPLLAGGRRPDLDVMRAFVVAGLIVLHSALVFAGGEWFVNDAQSSIAFGAFALWASTWGMPLLFVVSGMGAWFSLARRPAAAFVRERCLRLLVPLVFGLVVLVPPMWYLRVVVGPGTGETYGHFWLRFLNVPAMVSGTLTQTEWHSGADTFDVAHLWFLYVLLLLSIVVLPLFLHLRRPAGLLWLDRLAAVAERHPFTLLLAGAVPLAALQAFLGPNDNTGGWSPVAYAVPLLFGFLFVSVRRLALATRRVRWQALIAALVLSVGLEAMAGVLLGSGVEMVPGKVPGMGALWGATGWMWILAILGFAASWTDRARRRPAGSSSRFARVLGYANRAVLPLYILHEPVIVAVAWVIVRWEAPMLGKYLAIVVVSLALTVALYELLVRRFRLMGFLFGMKAISEKQARAVG